MQAAGGAEEAIPLPDTDDAIDLTPLAGTGGDPRAVRFASRLIRWLFIGPATVALLVAWHLAQSGKEKPAQAGSKSAARLRGWCLLHQAGWR